MTTPVCVARTTVRRGLFALLRQVEDANLTGLLRLYAAERELGRAMVARGRLCFAAPGTGQARIGDLLAGDDPAFRAHLDEVALDARRRKLRLCEALLERGEIALPALRAGLRRQTALALLAMLDANAGAAPPLELTPARDDYDPRLTFSALDVFLECSGLLDTAPEDWVLRLFRAFADDADAALLLTRSTTSGGLPLPLAARGLEQVPLRDVALMARAATAAAQPATLGSAAGEVRVVYYTGLGGVWLAASSAERIALLRTGANSEAGQIFGVALRLWRSG